MWCNFSYKNLNVQQYLKHSTLAVLLVTCMSGSLSHANDRWQETLPGAHLVGHGELTWFGLRIYQATLWAAEQPFTPSKPFALQLDYYRNISRERLVNASIREIKRLAKHPIAANTIADWESRLQEVLIDVQTGDQLIGVYLPEYGMRLYQRERLLGSISDMALAQAFFDIWLNPDTEDNKLRQQLLGGS
jgi:hypothetical protein